MNLNATLIGQMITFAVFVIFTMKYVWPPITKAMQEREKKIADGLAAGQRGQRDLELAQEKSVQILQEAKTTATQIIDQAHTRSAHILEEAKRSVQQQTEHLMAQAQGDIEQQISKARHQLQSQIASLALNMAEKILQRHLEPSLQHQLLDKWVEEL